MPIDANIILQGRAPDVGNALLKGFQGAETMQMMNIRQQQAEQTRLANEQKLQQQEYLSQILKNGVTASRLKPFIAGKDLEGFKKGLQESGLSPQEIDIYSIYADAGRWDQLGQIADQGIQLARDTGVFERDYSQVGANGYVAKDVQTLNTRRQLLANIDALTQRVASGDATAQAELQRATEEFNIFEQSIGSPQKVDLGGGVTGYYNPVTNRIEVVGANAQTPDYFTGTGGGAGGQMPPNAPPGRADNVNLNEKIDGGSSTSNAPSPNPQTSNWGASAEETIRIRDAALAAGKKLGEIEAKKIADLETFDSDFQANKVGLAAQFPEIDLKSALANAPNSSLTKVASKAWSVFMANPMSEGETELESFLQALAASVPFPPGSQSNAEMGARLARIGDIMKSGVSADKKLKMATRYLDGQEAIAKEKKAQAEKIREKYFGKPAPAPAAAPETPTGQSGDSVPAGIDPADWAVMTPKEKALWAK